MTDDIIHKDCSKCGRNLPLSKFNRTKHTKLGRTSHCKDCKRAYRAANKEKIATQKRAWYDANADHVREHNRVWREENAERISEKHKQYREDNAEAVRERRQAYRESNREQLNARKRSPEAREKARARYAHRYENDPEFRARLLAKEQRRRGAPGTLTGDQIQKIVAQDCFWCGTDCSEKYDLDHIVPLSKGGRNSRCNLAVSCPTCNRSKGAKDLSEWLREIGWR
jgi:5-methylcytosine-specific restriction endonuclease McrA